jgi:hypothetical protein
VVQSFRFVQHIIIVNISFCSGEYKITAQISDENTFVPAVEGVTVNDISTYHLNDDYMVPMDVQLYSADNNLLYHDDSVASSDNQRAVENRSDCTNEYHHLDFTLRSAAKWDHLDVDESGARNKDVSVLHQPCGVNVDESATASNVVSVIDEPCSLGEDESGARSKIVSVFDQPWDIQTSKFNMFVSSIRHNVVKGTRDLRNSLFGGQSRVNKCVENKNGAYSDVELNQHQFSSKLQRHDSSSCNNNLSTIEQKAEGQLEKSVASFPVLPYSDRIEVKSTNIYAEPLDRRTSMGNRMLKFFSTKESKMPFGVDLVSPRHKSRAKSRIYSLAKPIDETDESEV